MKHNRFFVIVLFVVLFLFIFVVINLKNYFKLEKFGFKKHVVQLTPEVHNPLIISSGFKGHNYSKIAEMLSKIYPLKIKYHDGSSIKNMENLINKKCDLAICQDYTVISAFLGLHPYKKKHENLRYVSLLYLETTALLVNNKSGINSWQDLKEKVICIGRNTFASYHNFMSLSKIAGYKDGDIKIIKEAIFDKNIVEEFSNGSIDGLYISTAHPKKEIYELYTKVRFKIIGIEGLKKDLLKLKIPDFRDSTINLNDYNMGNEQGSLFKQSLGFSCCIVTRDDVPSNHIYKLTKTLFSNIEYIKSYSNDPFFKKVMENVLPSGLVSFNSLLKKHKGSLKYFKEIGIITNNSNPFCANYVGTGKCFNVTGMRHFGHGNIG